MERRYDWFTESLAKELNLDEENKEVVAYGLNAVTSTAGGYLLIIVFSSILGVLGSALTAAITYSAFRSYMGGAHSHSQRNCITITGVTFPLLGVLVGLIANTMPAKYLPIMVLCAVVMAIASIYRYAPADTPQKPITDLQQIYMLRRSSFIGVGLWLTGAVLVMWGIMPLSDKFLIASTLGLLWESFQVTPQGYAFLKALDRTLG